MSKNRNFVQKSKFYPKIEIKKNNFQIKSPKKQKKIKIKEESLTLSSLSVGDFVAVKPDTDHYPDRKPLIAKITSIDLEDEMFEAVWWKKVT